MAHRIRKVRLLVHTRKNPSDRIDWFGSADGLRMFVGPIEIPLDLGIGIPPAPGEAQEYTHELDVDILWTDFMKYGVDLAVGNDAWAPRSAFVFGLLVTEDPGSRHPYRDWRWVPLAQNFLDSPNVLVCQRQDALQSANAGLHQADLDQEFVAQVGRWHLTGIVETHPDDRLSNVVLVIKTRANRRKNRPAGVDVWTHDPLEFSLFTSTEPDGSQPILLYHTVLPVLGSQRPGGRSPEPNELQGQGVYFIRLPVDSAIGFTSSRLLSARVTVCGDNAWMPHEVWLFGLSGDHLSGRLLGKQTWQNPDTMFSQDPHDQVFRQDRPALPFLIVPLGG